MADSKIEWLAGGKVWNPVTGCTPISRGCDHCYARTFARRLQAMGMKGYEGGFAVTLHPEKLDEPLHWRKPCRVFVDSMGDLFHKDVPLDFIARVFNTMACATLSCGSTHREHEDECWCGDPHTYIILTKRPARMRDALEAMSSVTENWPGDTALCTAMDVGCWPLQNVRLGVSVEDQQTADERIPILLQSPAAVRIVSIEPMLGPVDLTAIKWARLDTANWPRPQPTEAWSLNNVLTSRPGNDLNPPKVGLDWVILGGETGPGARPMHPDWVRRVRDDCAAAGVPFFFKAWGEWYPIYGSGRLMGDEDDEISPYCWVDPITAKCSESGCAPQALMIRIGKKGAGRMLDGRTHDAAPEATAQSNVAGEAPDAR